MENIGSPFSPPERISIEISRNCNLSCVMCGFGGQPIRPDWFMTQSLFIRIIREVALQVKDIRLNGRGESTLHPRFVEMIKEGDSINGVHLSLFTNLSWKNDQFLKAFEEHCVMLYLSIDSPRKSEFEKIRAGGSFSFFLKNLNQIKHIDPKPFLVFTLQDLNLHRILDIGQFALQKEVNLIYNVVRVDDVQYKASFLQKLENEWQTIHSDLERVKQLFDDQGLIVKIPDQIWGKKVDCATHMTSGIHDVCPNIKEEVFVGYDGTVYPCNMFNPFIYGNLMKDKWVDIWEGKKHQSFLLTHKQHFYCHNCEFICD